MFSPPRSAMKFLVPLLIWGVLSALYYNYYFAKARVEVQVEVEKNSWFKIYWTDGDDGFSEWRSAKARVKPGKENYVFYLTDLKNAEQLRIDPHDYQGYSAIEYLKISQPGFQDIIFPDQVSFDQFQPVNQIAQAEFVDEAYVVSSAGSDPYLLFNLEKTPIPVKLWQEVMRIAVLGAVVFSLSYALSFLVTGYSFVPLLLSAVCAMVLTMALVSKENVHPDEFVHVPAVQFYKDNWVPPVIDSTSATESYSPYGVSRLNTNEIYYLFAGKFAQILEPLHLNPYVASRLFNVFLLFSILFYTIRVSGSRIIALPLLISPQIWYLFSYCNSDAFAVAAAFFAGAQVVLSESFFNRYLRSPGWGVSISRGLVIGLGFGVLVLLKKNYWAYLGFLGVIVAGEWFFNQERDQRILWAKRLLLLLVAATLLLTGKKAADFSVNGLSRDTKIVEVRKQLADPMFNPDTSLENKNIFLSMKDRGVSLSEVITDHRWFEKTFRTAFGVYGYFTWSATYVFYDLVRWSALIGMVLLFGTIFIRGGIWNSSIALLALVTTGALIGASLHHSWTADLQTQGRYLFPAVGMLGVLCGQNRSILSQRWLSLLTVWLFCLGVYSFLCIGLLNMPHIETL